MSEEEGLAKEEAAAAEAAKPREEVQETEVALTREQEVQGLAQEMGIAHETLHEVIESAQSDTAAMEDVREELGLPEATQETNSQAANDDRLEQLADKVEDLEQQQSELGGDAPRAETPAGEHWVAPTPSEVSKGAPGSGFDETTFRKFSPEQRADIERHSKTFDGVAYNAGDKVIVNGSLATVVSFEGGGKQIIEEHDMMDKSINEKVSPAQMRISPASGVAEWVAMEGHHSIEPATGEAAKFAAKRSKETADIDRKLFGGLFEGGEDAEDAGDEAAGLKKAA